MAAADVTLDPKASESALGDAWADAVAAISAVLDAFEKKTGERVKAVDLEHTHSLKKSTFMVDFYERRVELRLAQNNHFEPWAP